VALSYSGEVRNVTMFTVLSGVTEVPRVGRTDSGEGEAWLPLVSGRSQMLSRESGERQYSNWKITLNSCRDLRQPSTTDPSDDANVDDVMESS
jgi:hypothetical protein